MAGANSAIADLYGRADAALKAISTLSPNTHTHDYLSTTTGGTVVGPIRLSNNMANWKSIYFQTNGLNRWALFANNDAESGGNAGSTLTLNRYNDLGNTLSTIFTINRANGRFAFAYTPLVGSNDIWHAGNFTPTNIPTQTGMFRIRDNGTHNLILTNSGVAGEFLFGGSFADGGPIGPYIRIGRNKLWFYDADAMAPAQYRVLHTGEKGVGINPVFCENPLDADTVVQPFALCSINTPTGTGSTFFWIFTMCYPNITAPTAKAQLAISYSAPAGGVATSVRRYYSSAWTPWATIFNAIPA